MFTYIWQQPATSVRTDLRLRFLRLGSTHKKSQYIIIKLYIDLDVDVIVNKMQLIIKALFPDNWTIPESDRIMYTKEFLKELIAIDKIG